MTAKHKTVRMLSAPAGTALGLLTSLAVTVVGAAVCAALMSSERIGQSAMGICAIATVIAASVLGALVTVGNIKRMRLQMCLLSGGCYYLLLLGLTALLFDGSYTGLGSTALGVLLGSGIVAAMGAMPKKGSGVKGRNRPYR